MRFFVAEMSLEKLSGDVETFDVEVIKAFITKHAPNVLNDLHFVAFIHKHNGEEGMELFKTEKARLQDLKKFKEPIANNAKMVIKIHPKEQALLGVVVCVTHNSLQAMPFASMGAFGGFTRLN